jgi:hypothetical protein
MQPTETPKKKWAEKQIRIEDSVGKTIAKVFVDADDLLGILYTDGTYSCVKAHNTDGYAVIENYVHKREYYPIIESLLGIITEEEWDDAFEENYKRLKQQRVEYERLKAIFDPK